MAIRSAMAQKNLLLLLDGHALVHRAFHALPPLSVTKTGEPTGAVYGFASMVLKVLNDFKPSHWAIAFDSAAPTFRHLEFEPYKAQRPKAPDELVSQFKRVRELVQAFNMPVYEVAGYEADDILGALCRHASEQDTDAIIVTGDTDTLQLVSAHIRVLTPRPGKPFSDTVLYDKDAVRQRYDLEPEQMADFKALKGDPSDNIPGLPGIGEKTAVKLIHQFGSVDGIYQRIEEVEPPKIREVLKANEQLARQSKRLATIVSDIPVTLDLAKCHVSGYDREKVMSLFRELEFSSLLPKLPETVVEKPRQRVAAVETATDYRIVDTAEVLDELMASLSPAKSLVIDVETTGKEARRAELVGIALSTTAGRAWYVPVGHRWVDRQLPRAQVIDRLKPLLEDDAIPKIAHNGKFDTTVLSSYGVELNGFSFDTMIAAYLLGEKSIGLKPLAFNKLGIEMTPITALIGTGAKQITMAQVLVPQAAHYACADADICGQLKGLLEMELKEQGFWSLFTDMEMPLVPVLFRLEKNGVALDAALLRDISQSLGQQMKRLEAEIYSSVGHEFNINSPQQLGAVLFEELKLPRARKTKGGYSTDASVLEGLKGAHPVVELLLEYRQIMKLKSTYIDALPALIDPETGRVHTNFNQTATATGRLSSSEPNLQNIPVRTEEGLQVRRAFIAEGDCLLLAADYSQIELRIMAHLSQDPRLLAAFAQGEDIHAATASQVFGVPLSEVRPQMRRVAKTVNFGVIYGMSDYGLEQATELSRQEAAQFISAYFDKYRGVKGYLDATKAEAAEKGYVQSLLGRRRYIPEINSANAQVRQAAERMAVNMPVQGTAADIIKLAMIELQQRMDERGLRSKMILQVHDELLFEVPPGELDEVKQLVLEVMPKALELSVPLKVEVKVGKNWGQLE